MESNVYCTGPESNGLTCDQADLELLEEGPYEEDSHFRYQKGIFRCRRCSGLYKHVHAEKYEYRFMDCDEGWWTTEDGYHKVSAPWTRDGKFDIEEARRYGYDGPEETLVNGRCAYSRLNTGLTCRFLDLAEVARLDKKTWIRRCRRCGQVYKQVKEPAHHFYKPGETSLTAGLFTLEEARQYGFRGDGR